MEELGLLFRLILAFLFLSTFVSKISDISTHLSIVQAYQIIPYQWSKSFTYLDLGLQAIVAISLLLGLFTTLGLFLAILLLGAYTLAISINLARGRKKISCGCGGMAGNHFLSWKLVLRNLVFISMAVYVGQWSGGWASVDHYLLSGNFGIANWVIAIFFSSVCISLLMAISGEISTFQHILRKRQG
ncbi:MauE/DoxX family redox-associated membrane protein [Brevibacillus porteri]|uniref:Methylamine utilization protein MauE n=1 Tax=Brevibacillus porteri TaxID=2126350 RepID=A0ABX5FVK3_9BACL|nr:MauE/DoxX family redox-associated membrane protein [Brevibacillus porteri]MED1799033.1 MauE/DoxX family redox-associated membrane protein [Brevibacillus porteri]MED2130059.1 MauE/DoxX family redox-associated membrane protein [Brevibacillus porteri]MED2746583.1 MauE/DoxX family redox-associated membrane protein [Brevibacillus porteri]MED2814578.1 MauE/DoxX family redox-associated membrane protein [Brevibacillus porteri]MED2894587.1 MauE/DoxX family redox-associated membrane protein [Brevibac